MFEREIQEIKKYGTTEVPCADTENFIKECKESSITVRPGSLTPQRNHHLRQFVLSRYAEDISLQRNMRIMLVSILLCFSLFSYGQEEKDSIGHISFSGVEINGSLSSIGNYMMSKGYKVLTSDQNIIVLTGRCLNYKRCNINIQADDEGLVYSLSVLLPPQRKWDKLVMQYYKVKTYLMGEYGKPTECMERIIGNIASEHDIMDYLAAGNIGGEVEYNSVWEKDNGTVFLSIISFPSVGCFTSINIYDKKNSSICLAESPH